MKYGKYCDGVSMGVFLTTAAPPAEGVGRLSRTAGSPMENRSYPGMGGGQEMAWPHPLPFPIFSVSHSGITIY